MKLFQRWCSLQYSPAKITRRFFLYLLSFFTVKFNIKSHKVRPNGLRSAGLLLRFCSCNQIKELENIILENTKHSSPKVQRNACLSIGRLAKCKNIVRDRHKCYTLIEAMNHLACSTNFKLAIASLSSIGDIIESVDVVDGWSVTVINSLFLGLSLKSNCC